MKMPKNTLLERLSLTDLDLRSDDFNAQVSRTPGIDRFCSSTYWSIPAHLAFGGVRSLRLHRSDAGFFCLALGYRLTFGFVMEPLEAVWGAACPLIGADPDALIESFDWEFHQLRRWHVPLMLSGVPPHGRLLKALNRRLRSRWFLRMGPTTRSFRASLEGGPDGFLSRRTRKFRANLRRAETAAERLGITFESPVGFTSLADVLETYQRILEVEVQSWKGRIGTGLAESAMTEFYRQMLTRLWSTGSLRVTFARHEGNDIGYVFGAQLDGIYRGLQISYSHRYASVSLGNLLQWHTIGQLCQESCQLYDLGIEVEYKARWGEDVFETVLLLAD